MKLGKLSLVAVMALGTSAFAIENVKVNGEAKFWYQTSEYSGQGASASDQALDYFQNSTNSMAEAALVVGATADLLKNVSFGVSGVALTTLGLENNLVGQVPAARIDSNGSASANPLDDQGWIRELYIAASLGKTTAKIGRQELNTPLAFTEKWNVVDNTFDAIVLVNNDIADTTLVGAWVGKDNGSATSNTTVNNKGKFSTFAYGGAYAVGAINKSLPETTVQAWYYNVLSGTSNARDGVDAYWLQADAKVMDKMIELGAQYANIDPKSSGADSTGIYAVKAGVNVANSNLYIAYSSADNGVETVGFSNVATGDKSNIYTALGSIYMDGENTTRSDVDAWKIGGSTKMVPGVTLSASYGQASAGNNGGTRDNTGTAYSNSEIDFSAWDVTANGNIGQLGLTAIYTQYSVDAKTNNAIDKDTDTLRIIASLKF